jgi:methionyl-tRNA formyltransferase
MLMDEGMDTGPMLAKISMAIPEEMTYGELQEALSQIALKPLWGSLQALQQGSASIQPQEEQLATYAPKIETGDGRISWNLPAKQVHDHIRAVTPKPGAWCPIRVREKSMTIRLFGSAPLAMQGEPGAILSQDGKELIVACAQGAVSIREVQLSGKNRVPSRDFLRGYPAAILEL